MTGEEILLGWILQISTPQVTPQNQALLVSPDSLQPTWVNGLAWDPGGSPLLSFGRGGTDCSPWSLGVILQWGGEVLYQRGLFENNG